MVKVKKTAVFSKTVIEEFCKLCNWTYESWITWQIIFKKKSYSNHKCGHFLYRLNDTLIDYHLLQITKLHDPAVQNNRPNLTIDYIITYGGWDIKTLSKLQIYRNQLNDLLAVILKPARNKVICHNDLETILNKSVHGAFAEGADKKYFKILQEFVNLVHDNVIDGPWPFNHNAMNDAEIFIHILKEAKQ